MKRAIFTSLLAGAFVIGIGCSSSTNSDKQPKLVGDADPNVIGPATPGMGGKEANQKAPQGNQQTSAAY